MASILTSFWCAGSSSAAATAPCDSLPKSSSSTGAILDGIVAGKDSQTYFGFIKNKSSECVAGIMDLSLGRLKADGTHQGKKVIRFDTGVESGKSVHVDINPSGYTTSKSPCIQVPESVVSAAESIQSTMETIGPYLNMAAHAHDVYRFGSSVYSDYLNYGEKMKKEEQHLAAVSRMYQGIDLMLDYSGPVSLEQFEEFQAGREPIGWGQWARTYLPENSIRESAKIAGGWTGGWIGGSAGAWALSKTGAMFGTAVGGPPGGLVCAIAGAVSGSLIGGVGGSSYASSQAETAAKVAIEKIK